MPLPNLYPILLASLRAWANVFNVLTLGTNDANWSGFTHRLLINSAQISSGQTGKKYVRLTFVSSSAQGFTVSKVYIQSAGSGDAYDFSATPIEVTFNSGGHGFSIGAGANIVSDAIAFAIPAGVNLVVSWYVSGDASHDDTKNGAATGFSLYYKSAVDDAVTVDATGYTLQYSNTGFGVNLIEASN